MRILFALTGYLPEIFGGAEVYTHRLARQLQARGHDVAVACLDFKHRRGVATDEHYDGLAVHRLGFDFAHRPAPVYLLQFFPEIYDEATEFLSRNRPDAVHITNAWFMSAFAMAALHLGIPVVATHVDFLWFCRESHFLLPDKGLCPGPPQADCKTCHPEIQDSQWRGFMQVRDRLMRLLAAGYAFHHCPCSLMARHLRGIGAPEDRIGVWPYGVNEMRIDRESKDEKVRLAFIGRWNRIKGVDLILKAMEQVKGDVVLRIHGEQEAWNKDLFAKEQLEKASCLSNVELMGRFEQSRLPDVLRDVDALVLASIWPENSPVSILEALALGVPVICSDGQGMVDLVRHEENGLMFRSRDADDLRSKIELFVGDKSLRRKLKKAARCIRTIGRDAKEFERIYQNTTADLNEHFTAESRQLVNTIRSAHEDLTVFEQRGGRM